MEENQKIIEGYMWDTYKAVPIRWYMAELALVGLFYNDDNAYNVIAGLNANADFCVYRQTEGKRIVDGKIVNQPDE